jgi:hypothetical protein
MIWWILNPERSRFTRCLAHFAEAGTNEPAGGGAGAAIAVLPGNATQQQGGGNGNGAAGAGAHGANGAAQGGGNEGEAEPVAPPVQPRRRMGESEAKAIRQRDKYKALFKDTLAQVGIDPESVEIEQTDDPARPWAVKGIEQVATAAGAGGAAAGGAAATQQQRDAAKARLTAPLRRQNGALQKQIEALTAELRKRAIVEPIRAACKRLRAIDDENGRFSQIVQLLEPVFAVQVEYDDESGAVQVAIEPHDQAGNVMTNGRGEISTIDDVVDHFLTKFPKFRQSVFAPGPGAGGAATRINGANGNGVQPTPRAAPQPAGDNDEMAQKFHALFPRPRVT